MTHRSFPLLCAMLLGTMVLSACGKKPMPGEVPTLTLQTYQGETYSFGPHDNKVTLVVFWATWCQPCIEEIPQLVEFQKTLSAEGFQVIGINIDDPEGVTALPIAERFGINYPLVVDDGSAEKAFGGLRALPTSFLVGRDGQVKRRLEGLYR